MNQRSTITSINNRSIVRGATRGRRRPRCQRRRPVACPSTVVTSRRKSFGCLPPARSFHHLSNVILNPCLLLIPLSLFFNLMQTCYCTGKSLLRLLGVLCSIRLLVCWDCCSCIIVLQRKLNFVSQFSPSCSWNCCTSNIWCRC